MIKYLQPGCYLFLRWEEDKKLVYKNSIIGIITNLTTLTTLINICINYQPPKPQIQKPTNGKKKKALKPKITKNKIKIGK
jgi:hypothetical protein